MPRPGAHVVAGGVRFRVPAAAERVDVVLVRGDGTRDRRPLARVRPGLHEAVIAGLAPGARYLLSIDGRDVPDPFARALPEGPHAPAAVCGPLAPSAPRRPLALAERAPTIYELHVGTFTPEGTFDAARARLPHLAALGVDAIELMPIASFPGHHGWGYDGVALLAPHAPYGAPEDVVAFVDAAHRAGLSVLLDVVLNHFGPDGNWLPAIDPALFDPAIETPWGPGPDFTHPAMRALAREALRLWVVEYGFDGLRLDATHAIVDRSSTHVLAELASIARTLPGPPVLIAEDERNEPRLVTELGLDGFWADDFHHAVHALLTGEQDGYYASFPPRLATLCETLRRGWLRGGASAAGIARSRLVYCLENHDQIGNRALGERFGQLVSERDLRASIVVLAFSPAAVLMFQGQEWAASTPFLYFTDHEPELGARVCAGRREEFADFPAFARDGGATIPDPQDPATFRRSVLDWDERSREPHAGVLALHRAALALRRDDEVLGGARSDLQVARHGELLVAIRTEGAARRVLAWNLEATPRELSTSFSRVLLESVPGALEGRTLAPRAAAVLAG